MNRINTIIAIAAIAVLGSGCAATGPAADYEYHVTPNQVVKDVAGHESVYSVEEASFVTLSPRHEDLNDHHGTMFVVGAFNRGGNSMAFGPSQIRVTDINGAALELLDAEDVKAIEEKRNGSKKFLSGLLATATTVAAAYVASDYIVDQQVAGYDTTLLQYNLNSAVAGIGMSAFNASAEYSENLDEAVEAQIEHFENKALIDASLSSNESGGGFFVVEGDHQAMIVEISAGGDMHRFTIHRQ